VSVNSISQFLKLKSIYTVSLTVQDHSLQYNFSRR